MKKIAMLAVLLAVSFVMKAQDYQYIQNDSVEDGVRLVSTTAIPIITNQGVSAMGFTFSSNAEKEIYAVSIITYAPQKWTIKKGDIAAFTMIEGANVYLPAYFDGECRIHKDNQYMISLTYEIPQSKIYDMLKALKRVTINMKQTIDTSEDIYIPFESAEMLMSAYLELLIATGK